MPPVLDFSILKVNSFACKIAFSDLVYDVEIIHGQNIRFWYLSHSRTKKDSVRDCACAHARESLCWLYAQSMDEDEGLEHISDLFPCLILHSMDVY